jgi:ribonuclease BN (tRNA processing enzyme)
VHAERDATAGRVADEARVQRLVLIHLSRRLADHALLLADARAAFERATLGTDGLEVTS